MATACLSSKIARGICALALGLVAAAAMAGDLRFETRAEPLPTLGFTAPVLHGALPVPLGLPRAHAFLVTQDNAQSLEARYDVFDLWLNDTVRGRWRDAAGNLFILAALETAYPDDPEGTLRTRSLWREKAVPIAPKATAARKTAAYMAAPFETGKWTRARRSSRQNLKDVFDIETTNACHLARAFATCPRDTHEKPRWYAVFLTLHDKADSADCAAAAEALDAWLDAVADLPDVPDSQSDADETELLTRAIRDNVANYATWRFTQGTDCLVVDNLTANPSREDFIQAVTNRLPHYRAAYAERLPTPLSEAVPPAVLRIFADREDYLAYAGEEAAWTAAIWSPQRRELVAYWPDEGMDELLETIWHEAFHQYLDGAAATLQAAPWFNEGHARLFQYLKLSPPSSTDAKRGAAWRAEFDCDKSELEFVRHNAQQLAEYLPAFLKLDYEAFYALDETQNAVSLRRTHYALAWSIAYFLEKGAPNVRFRPFENLRRDYLAALIKTRRMDDATRLVFTQDLLKAFVREWLKFFT